MLKQLCEATAEADAVIPPGVSGIKTTQRGRIEKLPGLLSNEEIKP